MDRGDVIGRTRARAALEAKRNGLGEADNSSAAVRLKLEDGLAGVSSVEVVE